MIRTPLRALIVDDEPHARTNLRLLLDERDAIEVVGECGDGDEAVALLTGQHDIDVVFLDVRMPGHDGLEVVRRLPGADVPAVVIVSAYDEYAIDAFDLPVVGYLPKPVRAERLDRTLARIRDTRGGGHVLLRSGGRRVHLRVEDIERVEAHGVYVRVHVRGEVHLVRESLSAFARGLPERLFLRTHRSHVVRVDRVREVRSQGHGDALLVLCDGSEIPLSRTRRVQAGRRLGLETRR